MLPIIDYSLPVDLGSETPAWFAMPEATPLVDQLRRASLDERVAAFAEIVTELAVLAERAWHHRDLKPPNLYYFKGRFVVGDFGLIKRPEDPSLTRERVPGPYEYMPNEAVMGEPIDPAAFDAFCLAKSMWVVLTDSNRPPQGQIRTDSQRSLALQFPTEQHIVLLDEIVESATAEDPSRRLKLAGIAEGLAQWIRLRGGQDQTATVAESAGQ